MKRPQKSKKPANNHQLTAVSHFSILLLMVLLPSCQSSGRSEGPSIFSSDETAEAGKIVASANDDLTKIKIIYKDNEGKREEIKKAMEVDDAKKVRELADSVNDLINNGFDEAQNAIDKIEKAQEMQINDDYREYLRLKEESLKRELEAFENYRQAARTLRDNYDPKNASMRDKVKEDFKNRVENYRKLMEEARDYSNRANDLAKDALRRQQQQ
jgi:hypothetical protein